MLYVDNLVEQYKITQNKKAVSCHQLTAFIVAEAGLEPTTFGL